MGSEAAEGGEEGLVPASTTTFGRYNLFDGHRHRPECAEVATELTRSLRDGLKSGQIKSDEISGRIGEIYDHIVDSKDALVEARDEVQSLKDQVRSFDDRQQIDQELDHDGYVYWRKHGDGSTSGPYCPFCWKKDNQLVPLTHIPGTYGVRPSKRYDCISHESFLVPTGAARSQVKTQQLRPNSDV